MAPGIHLPAQAHVARVCKRSACAEDGAPTSAAFEFRFDNSAGSFKEADLSVHWVECNSAHPELRGKLADLAAFLTAPVVPGERSISKNDRFAVLRVGAVTREPARLEGTHTRFRVLHDPRIETVADSHSSIRPSPGVEQWPLPRGGTPSAYQHAVQTYLADRALRQTHPIRVFLANPPF